MACRKASCSCGPKEVQDACPKGEEADCCRKALCSCGPKEVQDARPEGDQVDCFRFYGANNHTWADSSNIHKVQPLEFESAKTTKAQSGVVKALECAKVAHAAAQAKRGASSQQQHVQGPHTRSRSLVRYDTAKLESDKEMRELRAFCRLHFAKELWKVSPFLILPGAQGWRRSCANRYI